MADTVSHDHNFKNLIVEYPREALKLFAPEGAPARDDEASCVPVRQEQLKARLGGRFRELDVPLLVEWADGRRDAVLFALEEESDWRTFSAHRLEHYCLDLADMLGTDHVVPVVIFLRDSGRAPASLALGTERHSYLTFEYIACKLAEMPAERWLDSDNVVARVNLPNMRSHRAHRVQVYARPVRGLLELEPDHHRREKYLTSSTSTPVSSTMSVGTTGGSIQRRAAPWQECFGGPAKKACSGAARRGSGRCCGGNCGGVSVSFRPKPSNVWIKLRRATSRPGPRACSTLVRSTRCSTRTTRVGLPYAWQREPTA